MGDSTLEKNGKPNIETIAGVLAISGYSIKEIDAYFRSHDNGSGILNSGKGDGLLKGREFREMVQGIFTASEGASEETVKALCEAGEKFLEIFPYSKLAIDPVIEDLQKVDLNKDGELSLSEMGLSPKDVESLINIGQETMMK